MHQVPTVTPAAGPRSPVRSKKASQSNMIQPDRPSRARQAWLKWHGVTSSSRQRVTESQHQSRIQLVLIASAAAEGQSGVPPSGTPGAYALARTIKATNSCGRASLFQLIQQDTTALALRPRSWLAVKRYCDMQLLFQDNSGASSTAIFQVDATFRESGYPFLPMDQQIWPCVCNENLRQQEIRLCNPQWGHTWP